MKGVKVSNFIVPMSARDTYPTNLDIFGRGGIHSVDTILNRDVITTERRSEGMLSFTKNNESMYALLGGITNDKWFKLFDFSDNKVNFNIACDPNYVLLGNKDGVAKPSPRLRDMQFDIIDLRREFDKIGVLETLDHNHIWIGDYTNRPVMQKTIGVNNLPILGAALFPIPLLSVSIPIPNPNFNPTSGWDYVMSSPWLNQIYAGSPSLLNTSTETVISSSLAFAQIKAAQAIKRLDNAGFIVKSKTISYSWENPVYSFVTDPLLIAAMELYGLGTTYTFTEAQALDALGAGLLKNSAEGVLSLGVSGKDHVDVAAPIANMQLALIRPLLEDQGQDISKLISRIDKLPIDNLTNLTTGKIWQGVNNRPTEVTLSEAGIADKNATYILQRPDVGLPNAQSLSELAGGILKSAALTGTISIASGGGTVGVDDYVTPVVLTEEIEAVLAEATEAATVAGTEAGTVAGTTAGTASGAIAGAEAGAAAGATAGGIAGGTAGTAAAALVLFTKESTSDHNADISAVNTRIDNLHIPPSNAKYILQQSASGLSQAQVLSDLIGVNYPNGGLLKVTSIDGIIKIASPTVDYADPNKENTFLEKIDFQKDVRFLSKGAIKIPVGNTIERPSNPSVGMVRYNTELQ